MSADETPIYPDSFGAILDAILHGPDVPGIHTHTFRLPEPEYDENGDPLPSRVQSTFTVYRDGDDV